MNIFKIYTLLALFSIFAISTEIEYSYVPKRVYQNQVFPITFLSLKKVFGQISFTFPNKNPILKNAVVIHNGNKTFYTFYFKTQKNPFIIPYVLVNLNGKIVELKGVSIEVNPLPKRRDFCGVIASGLRIKNTQVSVYDEKSNLVSLLIEAYDANLEDIYIEDTLKDGIDNIKRDGSRVEGNYYTVLPADQKVLKFSYFDTIKNSFIKKKILINIDDGSVAAQTDLNPKDDKFEALKKSITIALTLIFATLFILKKDILYLLIALFSSIALVWLYIPLSKICVKSNSPIYIIPTFNGTIIGYTDHRVTTVELAKKGNYHKIEYKKGVIGWIKDEDICEN